MTSSHPLLPPLPSTSSSFDFAKRYSIPSPHEAHQFHPVATGSVITRTTLIFASVGTAVSSFQNALESHNKGAMGVFTRTGGTIAYFTAIGFAYSAVSSVTANIRETDDAINNAAGGCAAGFAAGIKAGSFPVAVGGCAFMGTLMGTFNAAGGSLTGANQSPLSRLDKEDKRKSWFKQKKSVLTEEETAGQPA